MARGDWLKKLATGGTDTGSLLDTLRSAISIDNFLVMYDEHLLKRSLKEHLNMLLSEKGLIIADVVRGSQLDRTYVYQIFQGKKKRPSRDKLIAIAFGMKLTEAETQRMLKVSDNAELYVRDKRDAIILYAIQRGMSIFGVNELLESHGMVTLGYYD